MGTWVGFSVTLAELPSFRAPLLHPPVLDSPPRRSWKPPRLLLLSNPDSSRPLSRTRSLFNDPKSFPYPGSASGAHDCVLGSSQAHRGEGIASQACWVQPPSCCLGPPGQHQPLRPSKPRTTCVFEGRGAVTTQLFSQEIPFPLTFSYFVSSLVCKIPYICSTPCSNRTFPLTGMPCLGGLPFSLLWLNVAMASHSWALNRSAPYALVSKHTSL